MPKPKTVCVIPAYNEEGTIGKVVQDVKSLVDLVIVVDDGSTDATAERARKAGASVVNTISNKGLVAAVSRGYLEALRNGADIIVQTDADNQYDAKDIPRLVQPIVENKADLVLGMRTGEGMDLMPSGNKWGNRIASWITSISAERKIHDAQTGFRALRREVLEDAFPVSTYTYTQEMIIRAIKNNWRVLEVPAQFNLRIHGKSRLVKSVIGYAVKDAVVFIRAIVEFRPLLFFGLPGAVLFFAGFVLGLELLYGLYLYLAFGVYAERMGTTILSVFLMISGITAFLMGFLADHIQTKYLQLRNELRKIK
ncbi:MAG: glycosyltransferase family 2 protein [Candidatus Diapherotrites archaeon]|nr:glycosyltransferase family 2 protein [Candidatus Diapherotrites archaeon]